jgi:hypothetical protein
MSSVRELTDRYKRVPNAPESAEALHTLLSDCISAGRQTFDAADRESLQQLANIIADQIHYLTQSRPTNQFIQPSSKSVAAPPRRVRVDITRLPETGDLLVGREQELALLHELWDQRKVNVVSIVGSGGAGKTSLLSHWLGELGARAPEYGGARHVFAWHFKEAQDEDEFLQEAAEFFEVNLEGLSSLDEKWHSLAEAVIRGPNLLVLDQFEILQDGPPRLGAIQSQPMAVFLRRLVGQNAGLCVITTRFAIPGFASARRTTAPVVELGPLTNDAGAQLLRMLKAQGTDEELRQASADYGGHALSLTLLGNYLRLAHGGDVRRRERVVLLDGRDPKGQHARWVCESYERWFESRPEGKIDLSIMRLFGLFFGPLTLDQFRYLATPPSVPGLNDELCGARGLEINRALERLQDAGLLIKHRGTRAGWRPFDDELDAHPLVREYFGDQLQERAPEAWKAGHAKLYRYLRDRSVERPETLDQMRPVYHPSFTPAWPANTATGSSSTRSGSRGVTSGTARGRWPPSATS